MEIILKNVTYNYKNKKLLNKVNLKIEANKITGITGNYKTLLCELLDGIKPFDGEIIIGDIPIVKENLKTVRKVVSLIHQDYESQFFTNNVKEEMLFLISRLSYKPKDINKKMLQSLKIVGLNEKILNSNISELSDYEKKLFQIAVSIIYNPDIIIFDEVLKNLDRISSKKIIHLIEDLKDKYNKTIIISSNDINTLYEITDNMVILKNGRIFAADKTNTIYIDIKDKDIDIPDLVMFTRLAKTKKVKLSYHKDIRDLIKDVYKHV